MTDLSPGMSSYCGSDGWVREVYIDNGFYMFYNPDGPCYPDVLGYDFSDIFWLKESEQPVAYWWMYVERYSTKKKGRVSRR